MTGVTGVNDYSHNRVFPYTAIIFSFSFSFFIIYFLSSKK
nr:MAG TPA: hypothetical protein [Caudoviricetes sp.]